MYKGSIVLEGGATRGIFTAGVLDKLMENDIYLSDVIGVSAGACNAVDYVSKQIGRTKMCMVNDYPGCDYLNSPKQVIKDKSVLNMDLVFDKYPNDIIPFDFDKFFESEMECELVTTNCITGKAEYIKERKDRERLMDVARASSSIPLLTPAVMIDDVPYLDGGLADSVPVEHALNSGNDKVVVVLTRNIGYRKNALSKPMQEMYRNTFSDYPELAKTIIRRSAYYNKSLNITESLERQGRIFVIRPHIPPVGRLERNKEALNEFYKHGYDTMEKQMDDLMAYLEK